MGNACGCAEDGRQGESGGKLTNSSSPYAVQFKQPGYQSKISPAAFAQISEADKDQMLAEALNILTNTVDSSKHASNNMILNKFLAKTVGKVKNAQGDDYEGELINGVANGKGRVRETNGDTYEGTMLNGRKHGEGKLTEANPAGFNGRVTYINDVAIGKTIFNSNTRSNFSKTSEGGYDRSGRYSGPYINISHEGDTAYELYQNDKRDGPFVVIANDMSSIALAEFKEDKEVSPLSFYIPVPPGQGHPQQGQPQPGQAPHQGQPAVAQQQPPQGQGQQRQGVVSPPANPQAPKA